MRQGLRSILDREADFQVTGEAASAAEALQLALFRVPDVAVIDLQLGSPTGIETAQAIWKFSRTIRVVFVSLIAAEEYEIEVAKAGACGVVAYERAESDLVKTLRSAAKCSG